MKTELVRIRCLPTEKHMWEQAAGRKNFSAWARLHLNEAANQHQPTPQTSLIEEEHNRWE